jgi:hypothetical protein
MLSSLLGNNTVNQAVKVHDKNISTSLVCIHEDGGINAVFEAHEVSFLSVIYRLKFVLFLTLFSIRRARL